MTLSLSDSGDGGGRKEEGGTWSLDSLLMS